MVDLFIVNGKNIRLGGSDGKERDRYVIRLETVIVLENASSSEENAYKKIVKNMQLSELNEIKPNPSEPIRR